MYESDGILNHILKYTCIKLKYMLWEKFIHMLMPLMRTLHIPVDKSI